MENKNPNKIDYTWDYKERLKRDSIMLLISALSVFVISYSKISPTFNRMGFLQIYTSETMRYFGLFIVTLVCLFENLSENLSFSNIWGHKEGRIIRLLAISTDLVLTYHIAKLTFIGVAVLGSLIGLL